MDELSNNVLIQLPEILSWSAQVVSKAGVKDFTKQIEEEIKNAIGVANDGDGFLGNSQPLIYNIPKSVLEAVKAIRIAGQFPYYLSRIVGCWFAIKYGKKLTPAALGEICNLKFEKQFLEQVAEACAVVLDKKTLLANPKRVALLKKAYEYGYFSEKVYKGCAQCTLNALYEVNGKKNPEVFRMATTLSAGMGLFGDGVCGGYSGGLLYLGSYSGRRLEFIDNDEEQKKLAMRLAELLHKKFIETYKTVICREIQCGIFGRFYNLRNVCEKQKFENDGAHTMDKCPAVVGTAAMWVTEILLDEGYINFDHCL